MPRAWEAARGNRVQALGVTRTVLQVCAVASLIALIALCVSWELWLAPLRPGGSWMVLKALPLLAPLFGLLHGRLYTFRWSAMLVTLYFVEGVVRLYAERGVAAGLAAGELVLALVFLAAALGFIRTSDARRRAP